MRRKTVVYTHTFMGVPSSWPEREALRGRLESTLERGDELTIEEWSGLGLTHVEIKTPSWWTWTFFWHRTTWFVPVAVFNALTACLNLGLALNSDRLWWLNLLAAAASSFVATSQVRAFRRRKRRHAG